MPLTKATTRWLFLRDAAICQLRNNGWTVRQLMTLFRLEKEAVEKIVRGT